jgi:hypothetical protein
MNKKCYHFYFSKRRRKTKQKTTLFIFGILLEFLKNTHLRHGLTIFYFFCTVGNGIIVVNEYFEWKSKHYFRLYFATFTTAHSAQLSLVVKYLIYSTFIIKILSNTCLTFLKNKNMDTSGIVCLLSNLI